MLCEDPGVSSPSAATLRRVDRAVARMSTVATARMADELDWFPGLSAEQRSWVGVVAQAGIASFATWLRRRVAPPGLTAAVFGTAPREMARAVTLGQTVEMVRITVAVVEKEVPELGEPGEEALLRDAVLRFSREVAFAGAEVYARAAEERGAWDARLEALIVDAVVRGEADPTVASRAAALGGPVDRDVVVVAGPAPTGNGQERSAKGDVAAEDLRRAGHARGLAVLAGVHADVLLTILGLPGEGSADPEVEALAPHFGTGTVVVGPRVDSIALAHSSAAEALTALRVVAAWPGAGRLEEAGSLLPERALSGDVVARDQLIARIHRPLTERPELLDTARALLEHGGGIEATSRNLFVHANTLRYRLRTIERLTGCDLGSPRHRFTAQVALALGALADR
jgi:hypothetical protein